jgi:membrane protein implicated in regulation of membrane protease activity
MPWWAWVVGGGALVALELVGADAAFYLVFIGAAALIVGMAEAGGAGLPVFAQWLSFAALATIGMVFFRERLYEKMRGNAPGFDGSDVGERVAVAEDVPRGGSTRVAMRGTEWDATNVGASTIFADTQATVVAQNGNQLDIQNIAEEQE